MKFAFRSIRFLLVSGFIATTVGIVADSRLAADDYGVVASKPSAFVMHAVRAQSVLDDAQRFVQLRGPDRVLAPETGSGLAYLSGFKIGNAAKRAPSKHEITMPDGERITVTLGENLSLYSPATFVGNGPSDALPKSTQYWIGYRVLTSSGKGDGELIEVAFPSQWWHHEEHEPVHDAGQIMLVFKSDPVVSKGNRTLIDPFGMNQMTATATIGSATIVSNDK